jgi:hypothetical protein
MQSGRDFWIQIYFRMGKAHGLSPWLMDRGSSGPWWTGDRGHGGGSPEDGRNSAPDEDITSMDTTSTIRWSWSSTYFRIAGKHLLATVVTASYGFQFGSSTTQWKDHQWIQPHVDTLSESVTITDFIQRCILSTVSLSYMFLLMILRIDCYLIML